MTPPGKRAERKRGPKKLRSPTGALTPEAQTLHTLRNTLGALHLRVGIVNADPTCRWAQEENLDAIGRLIADAMALTRQLAVKRR